MPFGRRPSPEERKRIADGNARWQARKDDDDTDVCQNLHSGVKSLRQSLNQYKLAIDEDDPQTLKERSHFGSQHLKSALKSLNKAYAEYDD